MNGGSRMLKRKAAAPVPVKENYLKYGFVITECISCCCPRCGDVLSAGPEYQPRYCSQCGQKLAFDGVVWKEEAALGYAPPGSRSGGAPEPAV